MGKKIRPIKETRDVERPDPALVLRLKKAVGAHQLRTGEAVSWKALAEPAGLAPSAMTAILAVERKVTIAEAAAFARRLGVSFAWLAIGEGPMEALQPRPATGLPMEPERPVDPPPDRDR